MVGSWLFVAAAFIARLPAVFSAGAWPRPLLPLLSTARTRPGEMLQGSPMVEPTSLPCTGNSRRLCYRSAVKAAAACRPPCLALRASPALTWPRPCVLCSVGWYVSIGFMGDGKWVSYCGGMLITQTTVLTAAHVSLKSQNEALLPQLSNSRVPASERACLWPEK